jgi:hypothetical protein
MAVVLAALYPDQPEVALVLVLALLCLYLSSPRLARRATREEVVPR